MEQFGDFEGDLREKKKMEDESIVEKRKLAQLARDVLDRRLLTIAQLGQGAPNELGQIRSYEQAPDFTRRGDLRDWTTVGIRKMADAPRDWKRELWYQYPPNANLGTIKAWKLANQKEYATRTREQQTPVQMARNRWVVVDTALNARRDMEIHRNFLTFTKDCDAECKEFLRNAFSLNQDGLFKTNEYYFSTNTKKPQFVSIKKMMRLHNIPLGNKWYFTKAKRQIIAFCKFALAYNKFVSTGKGLLKEIKRRSSADAVRNAGITKMGNWLKNLSDTRTFSNTSKNYVMTAYNTFEKWDKEVGIDLNSLYGNIDSSLHWADSRMVVGKLASLGRGWTESPPSKDQFLRQFNFFTLYRNMAIVIQALINGAGKESFGAILHDIAQAQMTYWTKLKKYEKEAPKFGAGTKVFIQKGIDKKILQLPIDSILGIRKRAKPWSGNFTEAEKRQWKGAFGDVMIHPRKKIIKVSDEFLNIREGLNPLNPRVMEQEN